MPLLSTGNLCSFIPRPLRRILAIQFVGLVLLIALAPIIVAQTAATPAPASNGVQLAPGLVYRHLVSSTGEGEPWSVHVMEIQRGGPLRLRAVAAAGQDDEMRRELPTELAEKAAAEGDVLAVVNGDYDAVPVLGVSVGLAVTAGRLWTGAKPEWPVMATTLRGEPVIGVPQHDFKLRARRREWKLTLNKPPAGAGLYTYTREYRPIVKPRGPVRVITIEQIKPGLPLFADREIKGRVTEVREGATEVAVPRGAITIVALGLADDGVPQLRRGERVRISSRVRVGGAAVHDVIGGFPILVQDGHKAILGNPGAGLAKRHPRTAACYNRQKIIFTVVDGRQPQLSVGMTLDELADLMVSLGCEVAINTDGGGSSVMAIRADTGKLRIVNSPSDGKERGRGNAWVVVKGK